MTEFLVLAKADGSDRTLVCVDQRAAARQNGYTMNLFCVDAPTRGFARVAWDAHRGDRAINYSGRVTDDDWGLESLADQERQAVVALVAALVDEDFDALAAAGAYESGSDPYIWTNEYGRWGSVHLVMPPGDPRHWSGGVERPDGLPGPVSVIVDMWTAEEGPSDLSLEAELRTSADGAVVAQFHGLHVM